MDFAVIWQDPAEPFNKLRIVDGMNVDMDQSGVEWYNALPRSGAIYTLIDTAESGINRTQRLHAVIALGKSDDPRAVRPLMGLLDDKDPEIRVYATSALGTLRSGRAAEALIGRLRDNGEQSVTRQQAAAALASIHSNTAIRGLRECIADETEDPAIRSYAQDLLSRRER